MRHSALSRLVGDREPGSPGRAVPGLRYAEVAQITDEGYVLTWLSGPVRSPSAPARAASFMAGRERGAYFPFEVGDEVIVGFEDGNLDQPVILGALWSEQDPPPPDADTSDTNNTRTIVSRAGSALTFDDSPGATRVLLHSAGGMEVLCDDSAGTLTLRLNKTTAIELSATAIRIQFDASTSITLDASGVSVAGGTINLN